MSRRVIVIFCLLIFLFLAASPLSAAQKTWNDVVEDIGRELTKAGEMYRMGDTRGAKLQVDEAYFGPYEATQMEKSVRLTVSAQANASVESGFREIKKMMTSGKDHKEVMARIGALMDELRQLANRMDGGNKGRFGVFLSSFLIIAREGFEAILILGAIIAYLIKSGNQEKVKVIYQGALLAILASLATAVAIRVLFNISGAGQEVLEGVTMLIATAVLASVSFWLVSKIQAKKWQNYIEGKVSQSLGKGSTFALWFAVFLAVYREGAETVLFYTAMFSGASESQMGMIMAGIAAGVVVLVIMFIVIRYGSVRIPIKPFFLGTSILMYYLAFVFAGQGINELQAGGVVGITPLNTPTVGLLGIYPSLESISLQGVLLLAPMGGLLYRKLTKVKTDSSAVG